MTRYFAWSAGLQAPVRSHYVAYTKAVHPMSSSLGEISEQAERHQYGYKSTSEGQKSFRGINS